MLDKQFSEAKYNPIRTEGEYEEPTKEMQFGEKF